MPANASMAHRLVREVLVRHMHAREIPVGEIAAAFGVTPTYIRRMIVPLPKVKKRAAERTIERVAAQHKNLLQARGFGFFFRD